MTLLSSKYKQEFYMDKIDIYRLYSCYERLFKSIFFFHLENKASFITRDLFLKHRILVWFGLMAHQPF